MKNNIDRREFLKKAGSAVLIAGGAGSLTACKGTAASDAAGSDASAALLLSTCAINQFVFLG